MSYLNTARALLAERENTLARYEINEINEKSPLTAESHESVTGCDKSEISEKSPSLATAPRQRCLPRADAEAMGLNPDLCWVRVSRDEVEASKPPADWDGTLPAGCRWPKLCQTLGPCPHRQSCTHHKETAE